MPRVSVGGTAAATNSTATCSQSPIANMGTALAPLLVCSPLSLHPLLLTPTLTLAGPHAPVEVDMTEADFESEAGEAAAAAVLQAHLHPGLNGSASGAVLDALEDAEAAFEQQHAPQQQQAQQQQLGMGEQAAAQSGGGGGGGLQVPLSTGGGGAGAASPSWSGLALGPVAGAPASQELALPPDTPRKAAICEATRERIIQKLFEALQANPRQVCWLLLAARCWCVGRCCCCCSCLFVCASG
jgi:hypothetical protein